jgi:hypothetical protein
MGGEGPSKPLNACKLLPGLAIPADSDKVFFSGGNENAASGVQCARPNVASAVLFDLR